MESSVELVQLCESTFPELPVPLARATDKRGPCQSTLRLRKRSLARIPTQSWRRSSGRSLTRCAE
jgi:hypothetical protein